MFGQNHIAKADDYPADGNRLRVVGIFRTIQGEGPFQGEPATFIRLHGCNLRCYFCDTKFDDPADPWMTVDEILAKAALRAEELVVITGGEPLLQNLRPLIHELRRIRTRVQIETAGSVWQDLPDGVTVVVSPKTPVIASHYAIAPADTYWKYPVRAGDTDPIDGLPNRAVQIAVKGKEQRLARPPVGIPNSRIWVVPVDEGDSLRNAANLIHCRDLALAFGYRLGIQLHKMLDLP